MATPFRHRALVAGLASGALALAGLLVMRNSGLDLTHGAALAAVCVSGVAGLLTLVLCWRSRFGLARLTAALSVAAVVVGWAAAQTPRLLPGLTVTQAAAGRSTLVALIIAVCGGAVILIPSLGLLFTLFLRGQLDTPEHDSPAAPSTASAVGPGTVREAGQRPLRVWGAAAIAGLVVGAGLLVFTESPWAHVLGVAGLILCAVAVFALAAPD